MNYLAHACLSFGHPQILVGNLISDFVKGKKKLDYPPGIQKGITLHRLIDEFTDSHEATLAAKTVFRPSYRLYSGALIDVIYDHFLATDENEFPQNSLPVFSQAVYATLDEHLPLLPDRFAQLFYYMKTQDWLFNYRTFPGTARSLEGLVRRALYLTESQTAYRLFEEHYQLLQQCYRQFWKELKPFARYQYESLVAGNP